jgi:SAM-dependent methyltransferase
MKSAGAAASTRERRWNGNIHYHRIVFEAVPPGCRTALDVGCGDGFLTRELRRQGSPSVTGIDRHEPSIAAARCHPDAGDITYVVGDVLTHPLEPESFDLVTAVASLHHMDTAAALARLRDLAAPGGVVAVVGLARPDLPRDVPREVAGVVASRVYRRLRPFHEQTSPIVWPPPDRYSDTRATAERLLPGVRWRRHVMFRYSLVWAKPPEG